MPIFQIAKLKIFVSQNVKIIKIKHFKKSNISKILLLEAKKEKRVLEKGGKRWKQLHSDNKTLF